MSVLQKLLHAAHSLKFSTQFQKYELYVYESAKQPMAETLSNLGLNICRNETGIASHLNTNVKVRQFSTECTYAFGINMHVTSKKRVFSYRIWAQPLIFFI